MTFESLPPAFIYWPLIAFIDCLESIMRNITPPKCVRGVARMLQLGPQLTCFAPPITARSLYLFRNMMGFLHTSQLYTLAELRVADHLANGSLSSTALASLVAPACGAATDAAASCEAVALRLTRLLRATAAYGVFREEPGSGPDGGSRVFAHTPASVFLRADHPYSLRASALNFGGVEYAQVRTEGEWGGGWGGGVGGWSRYCRAISSLTFPPSWNAPRTEPRHRLLLLLLLLQMEYLPESVVTGTASFRLRHGAEFWEWFVSGR